MNNIAMPAVNALVVPCLPTTADFGRTTIRPRQRFSSTPQFPSPAISVLSYNHTSRFLTHATSQEHNAAAETKMEELSPLPSSLRREALPRHVAIITDGNGRWAKARGLTVAEGHDSGIKALVEILRLSRQWGIRVVSVFAFSTENWLRPKMEVHGMMMLFESYLKKKVRFFMKNGIRVSIVGDLSKLPISLQNLCQEIVDMTSDNRDLHVLLTVNYGGRMDITQACKKVASKVKQGLLDPKDINDSIISQELMTGICDYPEPDLLIRTSGETRISNFLLWQLAYTEMFFMNTYWPDFSETDYIEALTFFQNRQRRFGSRKA